MKLIAKDNYGINIKMLELDYQVVRSNFLNFKWNLFSIF